MTLAPKAPNRSDEADNRNANDQHYRATSRLYLQEPVAVEICIFSMQTRIRPNPGVAECELPAL
jgi:hypothetical protein